MCGNIPEFECCDAPPSPASFQSIIALSGGPVGIVVFTYPTATGGCGNCQFTGAINTCYRNVSPFNTAYVVSVGSICANLGVEERTNLMIDAKEPVSDAAASAPSECKATHKPDTAIVNGQDYDITGPEREIIISDMLIMPAEEFATKWASVHKGLSIIRSD